MHPEVIINERTRLVTMMSFFPVQNLFAHCLPLYTPVKDSMAASQEMGEKRKRNTRANGT
jgi:hypothetical protein